MSTPASAPIAKHRATEGLIETGDIDTGSIPTYHSVPRAGRAACHAACFLRRVCYSASCAMAHPTPDLEAEARQAGEDEEQGLDWEHARELAGYFARAPRRRPKLAIATFAFVLAFAFATAVFWPRSYHCEVRLLAQKNLVLPALGNPGRAVPRDADNPT